MKVYLDNGTLPAAKEGDSTCGNVMQTSLKIEDDKMIDPKFFSFECAANIATGSITTGTVKRRMIEEA